VTFDAGEKAAKHYGPSTSNLLMVNEEVSDAVGAQPICERIDAGIIFARVTYEKDRHRALSSS
jgi:hypothetical protein